MKTILSCVLVLSSVLGFFFCLRSDLGPEPPAPIPHRELCEKFEGKTMAEVKQEFGIPEKAVWFDECCWWYYSIPTSQPYSGETAPKIQIFFQNKVVIEIEPMQFFPKKGMRE